MGTVLNTILGIGRKLVSVASMFGPFTALKFWVAFIVAIGVFINLYTGLDLGLDQDTVTGILTALSPILVWLFANKPKRDIPTLTEAEARARTGYAGPIETLNR